MEILDEIKRLPETVPSVELEPYFQYVISLYKVDDLKQEEIASNILFELSDKQWHNYERINEILKEQLDDFVIYLLRSERKSLFLIQNIGGVIGRLGLVKAYNVYKDLLKNNVLPIKIINEIKSVIKEFGNSIDDPYK